MKKSKSVLSLSLALLMLCTMFAGCGIDKTKQTEDSTVKTEIVNETETVTDMESVPETETISDTEAAPPKKSHLSANGIETYDDGVIRAELTALELADLMGNGTNLGNTMEAVNATIGNVSDDPTYYEILWGQPETTQEMFCGLKAAGFDSVRVPVAWMTNATTFAVDGNDTISEAYLDRVEQIINYALNADMYVIINDHWDGGWYGMFGSENEETRTLAMEAYINMWTQIAERYKEYSDYLIFEGANEEIGGRFDENSVLYCSDSETNDMSIDECYKLANQVNQAFVDAVRATGQNNANRFLLIPGYSTNIDLTCDDRFVMPTDIVENKLLISVHYYDPGTFCGAESYSAWGIKSDYEAMNSSLKKMTKFTDQGYGVVIGEYAVFPTDDGQLKENAVEYHANFLDICNLYGYNSCLWDCSTFFIRRELKMAHEELAELYLSRSYQTQLSMSQEEIKNAALASMSARIENAPETNNKNAIMVTDDTAVAWLMWTAGDWNLGYHADNEYNPDDISVGIVNTDVVITDSGTYTVGLDFTGTTVGASKNIAFAAVGIANGESLFPHYVIDIQEVLINGEAVELSAKPYTTSDGNNCTRVNLYNEWVSTVPVGVRTVDGSTEGVSPCVLDLSGPGMENIETVSVTFYYGAKE